MKNEILSALLILPFLFFGPASSSEYQLSDTVTGDDFYGFFDFQDIPDPTHGRVNYVDMASAIAQKLTYAEGENFILRADYSTVLDPNGPGRDSVRLRSTNTYTTHVAVFDINHMPEGCGTWPAVWETTESGWPNGGEIDIVEGVNDQSPNTVSLHTSDGCTMPESREQAGTSYEFDCNALVNNNVGCTVKFPESDSYGPAFNANGGGWFAVERAPTYVKIFFWPRSSDSVPDEVRYGAESVNPDTWGNPVAFFPDTSCDMSEHFNDHNIIINLTFCGDWAGSVYEQNGCPSTCVDFVNNNPGAFENAYFDFASLRVYS